MPRSPLPNLIGRWMAGLAAVLVVLIVWGGFEIRDEAVESPTPRSVRLTAAATEPANAIEYVEGYEAGLRRATAENRPLLVVFRAAWCHWCAEFARGALIDPRLVGLSRQFVCVVVDADRHAADCRRFGVREFPTVVVATANGDERRRWTGCPSADELVSAMTDTLPATRIAVADEDDAATTR
jgi:thiol:disulfide interchange protein